MMRTKRNGGAAAKEQKRAGSLKWTPAQRRAVNAWLETQAGRLQTKEFAEVVMLAMIDPKFRRQLLASPAAALREAGIKLAGNPKLRVHENSSGTVHLVLPPKGGIEDSKLVLLDDDLKSGPLWQDGRVGGTVKKDLIINADPHRRDADVARPKDPKHPGSQNITDDNDPSRADKAMTKRD